MSDYEPRTKCDWRGDPVPVNEDPNATVLVWQVEPHVGDSGYDALVIRDYYQMMDYVSEHLDLWLDVYDDKDLKEHGAKLLFKLVEMQVSDIP